MGLAGRKQKQRIPTDPRNLSWADDASRFGLAYLSKFGWDASQGLGSSGDGMKTHVKVQQKLDMMGIGAQHQRDPNGIAWKQNKEFEALLKRLNDKQGAQDTKEHEAETEIDKAFVRQREEKEKTEEESEYEDDASATKKKRKRATGDKDTGTEKKQKKERAQNFNFHYGDCATPTGISEPPPKPSLEPNSKAISTITKPKPRPMAHRARIRAAKNIASKSPSAISEILGIAPSSSLSTPDIPTPPFSLSSPDSQTLLSLGTITTSAKSVADYFKEKLGARSSPSSLAPSEFTTPTTGLGWSRKRTSPTEDEENELLRRSRALAPPPSLTNVNADIRDSVTDTDGLSEKQRRKAGRKAEKRERRVAEAEAQEICEPEYNHAAASENATEKKGKVKRTGTSPKKKQKHLEGEQTSANQPARQGDTAEKQDTLSSSSPQVKMKKKSKSKKDHDKDGHEGS